MKVFHRKSFTLLLILFSFSLLNACSRFNIDKNKSKLVVAYSKEESPLIKELERINTRDKRFRNTSFIEIEYAQTEKLLKSNRIDAYIGTILDKDLDSSFNKYTIAKNGIIVIVNPRNQLKDISLDNLAKIFSKQIDNWQELGLGEHPIILINKKENALDRMFLESNFNTALEKKQSKNHFEVTNDKEAINLVEQFEHSISYISFSALNDRINTVSVNHIAPTQINISSGNFPVYKPIFIYEGEKLALETAKREALRELLDFLWLEENEELIKSAGLSPLSKNEIEELKSKNSPLLIGVSAPLSGPYAELGRAIVNGTKLAVMQNNNSQFKKHSKTIELIICDDKAELSKGLECAKSFIEHKVLGVIGHLNSQISIEASKLYSSHNIVQISPGSTHPWLTENKEANGKVFRTINIDETQAEKIASAISKLKNPPKEKILILHNGTIYGSNLATLIENHLLKQNLALNISSKSFNVSDTRYHLHLKENIPDTIVFIGEYGDAAQMLVDLALDNKSNISFFGADGNFSKRFIDLAGLRAEGAYIIGCDLDENSSQFKSFEKLYRESFRAELSSFSIYSYDAANILINSIQEFEKSSKPLSDIISASKTPSYCGEISFNEKGNPSKPRLAVFKVLNGKFVKTDL